MEWRKILRNAWLIAQRLPISHDRPRFHTVADPKPGWKTWGWWGGVVWTLVLAGACLLAMREAVRAGKL